MRGVLKLVAINAIVFLALLGGLFAMVMLFHAAAAAWAWMRPPDARYRLPNYQDIPWAEKHFREFRSLKSEYHSYIGWRRQPYNGSTITVEGENRERRTVPPGDATKPLVYFFGGSTMWGTGADDASTIPSLFSRDTGFRARNFGESGYTAHQNLQMLLRLLQDGHRPDIVVFYDGVNDVAMKCRTELSRHSTAQEAQFKSQIEAGVGTLSFYLLPFGDALNQIKWKVRRAEAQEYDCQANDKKADAVAGALIHDWNVAKTLVQARGIRFIAVLQPVSYFSKTKKSHLSSGIALEMQFLKVYPKLRDLTAKAGFYSVVDAVDVDENVYIDFCHLSPNGNALVARRLAHVIR